MNDQKIFITSDWHFNHKNTIIGQSKWDKAKPFRKFDSVAHMNTTLIDRINERVRSKDILWCLGDVNFGRGVDLINIISRINCNNINLIYGNHDSSLKKGKAFKNLFTTVQDYKSIKYNGQRIVMFHYALITWNAMAKGSIQLYGHSHGNLPDTGRRQMDVGVDTNDYYPYSLDEVVEKMNARPIGVAGDHHDPDTLDKGVLTQAQIIEKISNMTDDEKRAKIREMQEQLGIKLLNDTIPGIWGSDE